MSQDAIDDVLALNRGDDLYRSTAMTADLDIDIEDALESLGPGHCDVPFSGGVKPSKDCFKCALLLKWQYLISLFNLSTIVANFISS